MTALSKIRQQLRAQFPAAHETRAAPPSHTKQGLPDFPRGALTELTANGPAAGLSLVIASLLESSDPEEDSRAPKSPSLSPADIALALIDGSDSFDPRSYSSEACSRLLWIRCHSTEQALRCTDLLLRDGNLPLLALDLQLTPLAELRAIASSSWYRLRNLAEQSGTALLAFTPHHLVPCAALQLTFPSHFTLSHLTQDRQQLLQNLHTEKQPSKRNTSHS